MKNLKRNTCKICGFKSDVLSNHIVKEHADLGDDPLVEYIQKFDVTMDDIVHPDIRAAIEEKKSGFRIADVPMAKYEDSPYVPELDPAYFLPESTKDICLDINTSKKVMLVGQTGTGKTSLVTQLAAQCNQGCVRVNMNAQTTVGDFVGLWTVKGGETIWVDGVLPLAMKLGLWLIIDEIDFADAAILSVLNSVLEKNGKLTLKEKGYEIVEPHENFRIFATANGIGSMSAYRHLYQGTNAMNEAFLDRWRVYHIDYLPEEKEIDMIVAKISPLTASGDFSRGMAKTIVRVANMLREAFNREEIRTTFSHRKVLDWAELMIRHKLDPKAPLVAAEIAIFSKTSAEDAEVIKQIIQKVMMPDIPA